MNNRIRYLFLFGLLVLVQLYVPASMILNREDVLATGKPYRFRSAPLDPSDPFRGKYITLRYDQNAIAVPPAADWESGELVYLRFRTDAAGFARIHQISKTQPAGTTDFLRTRVDYIQSDKSGDKLFIYYHFDRFYMEESKALPAEQAYAESLRDTSQVTYALVHIKGGQAVLKDVLRDGVPIREQVEARRQASGGR